MIEIISAIRKFSKRDAKIINRKRASFNIRISGIMEYDFGGKRIISKPGDLVYLPKGCNHVNKVISECESECMLIYISGDNLPRKPAVYSLEHFVHSEFVINTFADMWNFGTESDKYICTARFYDLLAFICNYDNLKYPDKKKIPIIQPAIEHLKHHIYDTDLRIDNLHQLCGVSHTYFRKIFISETGKTPKEYVIEKRLSYARVIIENGEMDSVKKLANIVGYADPLYFSKAFKEKFGVSPTVMNSM